MITQRPGSPISGHSARKISLVSAIVCWTVLVIAGLCYYPKWQQTRTEATISWDVSGYYFYLPAVFIYKDLKNLAFKDKILSKYYPTPDFQQAYQHDNGNYILKYSSGQAIQFLPFFVAGHLYACAAPDVAADGFSWPYQLAINLGSIFVACLGLWILRKVLLRYYNDTTTAVTLLAIVAATNYLDYAAINGAMTHNYLFTLYAALMYQTIRYYEAPDTRKALMLGLILGLMVLTRPTEMLAGLIPLLWGVQTKQHWKQRREFIKKYRGHLVWLGIGIMVFGLIQVAYWLYVSGAPFVYSYQGQGFKFFKPHIINGILSYRSGWLVYSPAMLLSLLGLWAMWRQKHKLFPCIVLFTILFIWVTFAWNPWTYGGALGQRAMVQSYAVLAFPLAATIQVALNKQLWVRIALAVFLTACISYNVWLTHHAHKGGLLRPGAMTKAYFWKMFGKNQLPAEAQYLLDTNEYYSGPRNGLTRLASENFEDWTHACRIPTISGVSSACIPVGDQVIELLTLKIFDETRDWITAAATFRIEHKEWETWRQGAFTMELRHQGVRVKSKFVRPMRLMEHGETLQATVFVRKPKKAFDEIMIYYVNYDTTVPILIDDLVIETFDGR